MQPPAGLQLPGKSFMFTHIARRLPALLLASLPLLASPFLLSACGGGGGGGSAAAGAAPAGPAVTFTPAKVSASFPTGTAASLTATATINRPSDFDGASAVYATIVDDTGVILPAAQITQTGSTQYSARLTTVSNLTPGTHTGSFSLRLCRDAACTSQFPGSPTALPYELTVTAPQLSAVPSLPLAATVPMGAVATTVSTVSLGAQGRNWTVSSDAAWLKPGVAAGADNALIKVTIDPTGIAAGNYSATLTFKSSDGSSASVPASLTVVPAAFVINGSSLTFSAVNGAPIASQALNFSLNNAAPSVWSATSDASWLSITPNNGVTPAAATVSIDPHALAAGSYAGKLTLNSPQGTPAPFDVKLNLIPATLTVSNANVVIGGADGRSSASAPLIFNLNTQALAYPWTLGALPAWLQASASAGTVSQSAATISLSATAAAPLGSSSSQLSISSQVNGDIRSAALTVTVNKDQRRLLPAETAVALSATPSWSRLNRTIKVRDNFGLDGAWSASADQAWLSVSASGQTVAGSGTLTLSADPAALPTDAISYATITMTPASGVTAPEKIRVALWKGSSTPDATTRSATSYNVIAADPLRPYVYLHSGGTGIDVFNVYTGAKVATIASVGASLGTMAVSPNGGALYVFDYANRAVDIVNLDTMSKSGSWTMPAASGAANLNSRMLVLRPDGVEVVVTNQHGQFLASNGALLSPQTLGGEIGKSGDGRRVVNSVAASWQVDFSAVAGGSLFMKQISPGVFMSTGAPGSVAANSDGSRLYTADGAPYQCMVYSADNGSTIGALPGGDAYPNNIKVASDGRIYCGISGWYSAADVWVYRSDGSLQTTFKFAGYARELLTRQLAVSGDGLMMVALTSDPYLVFVPVGP